MLVVFLEWWLTSGLGLGGMWGVIEALQKPRRATQAHTILNPTPSSLTDRISTTARAAASATSPTSPYTAPRQSGKLLLNSILHNVTRRGPFLGHSTGVLALSYNIINSYNPKT